MENVKAIDNHVKLDIKNESLAPSGFDSIATHIDLGRVYTPTHTHTDTHTHTLPFFPTLYFSGLIIPSCFACPFASVFHYLLFPVSLSLLFGDWKRLEKMGGKKGNVVGTAEMKKGEGGGGKREGGVYVCGGVGGVG